MLDWGLVEGCGTWGGQEERNMVGVATPHLEQTDGRLKLVVVQWAISSFVHLGRLLPLDRARQKEEYARIGFD